MITNRWCKFGGRQTLLMWWPRWVITFKQKLWGISTYLCPNFGWPLLANVEPGVVFELSHTWVRYPGFSGHGIKCPRWFQDFLAIWLAVPFGANGTHSGICTLPEKSRFVCGISCFGVKLSFLKRELVMWSLYGDKLSICRNQQMNGKI